MKTLLFFILAIIVTISGCKGNENPVNGNSTKKEMSAKINGTNWTSTTVQCRECINQPTPNILLAGYYEKNGHVQSHILLSFPPVTKTPKTITYPLNGDSSSTFITQFQNFSEHQTYIGVSGQLTILTYEGIGGNIKGNFHIIFVDIINGVDTLNITNGEFNIPITKCY